MIDGKNILINEHGLYIKSNGIAYNSINHNEVKKAIIARKQQQRFWIITFCIGLLILGVGFIWFVKISLKFHWDIVFYPHTFRIVFLQVFSPIIIGLLGIIIMYSTSKKDWMLILEYKNGKHKRINIADIEKAEKLNFAIYLLEHAMNIEIVKQKKV